jgi:CRISPR/Cas system-associated exonuclease Cas4 (RecB family)
MHRVLRTYFDSVRFGRPKTEVELIDLFRLDLAGCKIQEPYQHELYERQGVEQLRQMFAQAQNIPPGQVLHTEEPFEIRVGETVVAGRIDRIDARPDGTVTIIDYKTGKARDQDSADKSLQLSLYAIAAREKWKYKVGALQFYNLEDNLPVISTRTEAQLIAAKAKVETAAEDIAAGRFDAKPGMHCAFCAFRILCPVKEKRIANFAPLAVSQRY